MTTNTPEYNKLWRQRHSDAASQYCKKWEQTHPETVKRRSLNRVGFLGKQIHLGFRQITGYCSQCPNNIYDYTCKKTDMHHLKYLPCMPWACRIELCTPCHRKMEN